MATDHLADWSSAAISSSIRRPWDVFETDVEEEVKANCGSNADGKLGEALLRKREHALAYFMDKLHAFIIKDDTTCKIIFNVVTRYPYGGRTLKVAPSSADPGGIFQGCLVKPMSIHRLN